MVRIAYLLCLAVCVSATIMDRHLGPASSDKSNALKDNSFWKSVVDFLVRFNTSQRRGAEAILQPKTSGGFRQTKLKDDDHHPYMTTIYQAISGKQHQKWTAMETEGGATIRGIEPYKVVNDQNPLSASIILDFNIETIDSLDDMKHVELCLSSDSPPSNASRTLMNDDAFQVELLLPKAFEAPPKVRLSTYRQQGRVFLELTTAIRGWWNLQLFKAHRKLRLRISREDGSVFHLDRPLIIFYYKASAPERAKDMALFGATHEALLRKARDVHMPPRVCSHCVYGERKTPLCQKHRRHNLASCALHIYYISLEALQWDHLFIAPKVFQMNYCSGSCNGAMADTIYNATMHAIARAKLLHSLSEKETEGIPPPYCVPSKLKDIDSMYKDNQNNIVLKKWEKIVADQCGCS